LQNSGILQHIVVIQPFYLPDVVGTSHFATAPPSAVGRFATNFTSAAVR